MKIGVPELLIVLAVVIVIFGPTQIPKLTSMLGKSIRNLREGIEGIEHSSKSDKSPDDQA